MTKLRFSGLDVPFQSLKNKVIKMPASDMPTFRHKAFYMFIAKMLGWFESYPDLASVTVEHALTIQPSGEEHHVAAHYKHRIRLHAPVVGFHREANPEDHEHFVSATLPYPVMGAGSFEIQRSDFRIQRFLSLTEDDVQEWEGVVASIADSMDRAFGDIRVHHSLV